MDATSVEPAFEAIWKNDTKLRKMSDDTGVRQAAEVQVGARRNDSRFEN
jgi:hypothetical protein